MVNSVLDTEESKGDEANAKHRARAEDILPSAQKKASEALREVWGLHGVTGQR